MKAVKRILCIALVMILAGTIGAMLIQTDGGHVKIENVKIISQSGHKLSMDLYIPDSATKENPGPAIFVQHGGNNNKEEMQHYCIELARRGYVTFGVDMYNMGESAILTDAEWLTMGRGLYDAVRYGVTLPYVDRDRISLLGYSRGGKAAGEALECDNAELNVVKAIFLIHSDPIVRNNEGYTDVYGPRDISVLADKNDEFFFSEKAGDNGTYSNDANKYAANLSSPAEYIINNSAQSFLYFGEDPATTTEKRVAETVYSKEYEDGRTGTREIHVSNETHMTGWWSPLVMGHVISFFDRVMPTGSGIASNSYTYILWNVCKLIALAGLVLFTATLVVYLVNKVKAFQPALVGKPEIRPIPDSKGRIVYWCLQAITVIGCILIVAFLNRQGLASYRDGLFISANPTYHGLIALLCGTLILVLAAVWLLAFGKKSGFTFAGTGLALPFKTVLLSLGAVAVSVAVMMLIVILADYLLDVNFLFIYWGFMVFDPVRIPGMLLVSPLYLLFYLALSASVNGFNFNNALGKNKVLGDVVTAFLASLPTLFILGYVYGIFRATGNNPMFGSLASAATAVFAFPGFVFVSTLVCRYLYRQTGNPYLGGLLCGILAAIAEWSVCEIRVHNPGATYAGTGMVWFVIILGFVLSVASFFVMKNASKK